MTGYDVHADKALRELRARLDQAERERDEARREMDDARAEQRDAEASRDLLVAGYTRAIREWLATHPGDSVPDVVDLFGAVMTERDAARAVVEAAERLMTPPSAAGVATVLGPRLHGAILDLQAARGAAPKDGAR